MFVRTFVTGIYEAESNCFVRKRKNILPTNQKKEKVKHYSYIAVGAPHFEKTKNPYIIVINWICNTSRHDVISGCAWLFDR